MILETWIKSSKALKLHTCTWHENIVRCVLALCCVSFVLHNISLSGCFHLLKSKVCQNILLYGIKIAPYKAFVRVLYTVMVHNLERESRIINLQDTGFRLMKLIFSCYQLIVQISIGVITLLIKIKQCTKCSVSLFLILCI